MTTNEIRQAFLEFFNKKQHKIVESSNLVPFNDPTLLFTNSGMVQFKEFFLGKQQPQYSRAVTVQKCLRAGGKHNDLENVGYTARHHTFFEMLGNFSFGDYFKREAINFAWEFVTQVLKLPEEKLWITVYKDDLESADIWLKELKVSSKRFSYCGEKDNFWSMGDTGPCGPCTEIFYDHGPEVPGGPPGSPEADGDRYTEIWNLVFMQYNRDSNGVLKPLPKPCVDTGMGLERVAAVLQHVKSNYHIDLFQKIINGLREILPNHPKNHPSLNVVADHIRAISFLISEGVLPSNEGRGYVLRRIIRRAVRHANKLGAGNDFFAVAVRLLVDAMGTAYPELIKNQQIIIDCVLQEEQQFIRTLEQGLVLLNQYLVDLSGKVIAGELAFKLYDTYGFPLDLTQDLAREHGLEVDLDGFDALMQQQIERSKATKSFNLTDYSNVNSNFKTAFHGYDNYKISASLQEIWINNTKHSSLKQQVAAVLVLDHTPFYAESGGQIGDRGIIQASNGIFSVSDTQRVGDSILHYGVLQSGSLAVNDKVTAEINSDYRQAIRNNHSATHLLHAALKQILGNNIEQKGSLVNSDISRFDFSYNKPLSYDEIYAVEHLVNLQIRKNLTVDTAIMGLDIAKARGAVALFGEKYSDEVRVLSMGEFSQELCGGTHVNHTGEIGIFKIITEYSVASGVRRIEFVTSEYAINWLNAQLSIAQQSAELLKSTKDQLPNKINLLLSEIKQLKNTILQLQQKQLVNIAKDLTKKIQQFPIGKVLITELQDLEPSLLRNLVDKLRQILPSGLILLYIQKEKQLHVACSASKDLLEIAPKPVALVKLLCGKGGGRDDFAQGGSEVPSDFNEKIANIHKMLGLS